MGGPEFSPLIGKDQSVTYELEVTLGYAKGKSFLCTEDKYAIFYSFFLPGKGCYDISLLYENKPRKSDADPAIWHGKASTAAHMITMGTSEAVRPAAVASTSGGGRG